MTYRYSALVFWFAGADRVIIRFLAYWIRSQNMGATRYQNQLRSHGRTTHLHTSEQRRVKPRAIFFA